MISVYRETNFEFCDCSFDVEYVGVFGTLAQLVEHRTFNPLAAGSNPACPTISGPLVQLVRASRS